MNSFRECFPKNHIPEMAELEAFWGSDISELFRGFAEYLQEHFDLRFGIPVWSEKNGWTYRVGRSGVYLITGIIIDQDAFLVGEIKVKDRKSYRLLLEYVDSLYAENGETLVRKIAKKNIRQAERNKRRIEREREEKAALRDRIVPQDTELADEIGLTLYLRCKYGKEDMERMERYAIRCHHCQAELSGDDDFRECRCGYQYSYREYRRNYRRNNMPTGAAAKVFEAFLRDWSAAEGYPQKMFLIDSLLHEFHLSLISGVAHRPVAMNFLDGTLEKVTELINSLARE